MQKRAPGTERVAMGRATLFLACALWVAAVGSGMGVSGNGVATGVGDGSWVGVGTAVALGWLLTDGCGVGVSRTATPGPLK